MTTPPRDRIKRVRFAGLRTAANVELELEGLTVLIGQNGVGKTTLVEGCELLRRVMSSEDFVGTLHDEHGGPVSLVTHGQHELRLGVDVETVDGSFAYDVVMGQLGDGFGIARESLFERDLVFSRTAGSVVTPRNPTPPLQLTQPREPFLHLSSMLAPTERVGALLHGIEVHGPFKTHASWINPALSIERNARSDNVAQATTRLARGATNLPNAFRALSARDDWQDTLETIQLLIDQDIEDVLTPQSPSGGTISLAVRYRTGTVPASALSDGTLSLLSLVAVTRLDRGQPERSLLVLDEPDLHIDPATMRYVVALLERCAERYPVIVATHSDQLLDCLSDPASSAVLCELDEHRHLRLRRPDAERLEKWRHEYRGLGELRAEGFLGLVLGEPGHVADNNS